MLQGYSRDLVAADNTKAIVSITSQALAALFQVPVVVMLVTEGTVVSFEKVGDVEPHEAELEAARSSLATGTVARGSIYPDLASRFDFWPVKTAEGQNAVIGLAFDPDERPSAPDALAGIVRSILALVRKLSFAFREPRRRLAACPCRAPEAALPRFASALSANARRRADPGYGYRPGKSALEAIAVTRRRCWDQDWVVEFDIRGLFDNLVDVELLRQLSQCSIALDGGKRHLGLEARCVVPARSSAHCFSC